MTELQRDETGLALEDQIARNHQRTEGVLRRLRFSMYMLPLVCALVVAAVLMSWQASKSTGSTARKLADLQRQATAGKGVAQLVTDACKSTDKAKLAQLGVPCAAAQSVAASPSPSVPVAANGIASSVIDQRGHLILTYTQTGARDVGVVVGPAGSTGAKGLSGTPGKHGTAGGNGANGKSGASGANGANGSDGRGISNVLISDAHLILSFTDSTTTDAGQVVGPAGATGAAGEPGRSVLSITINADGHLIVTYDDSTTTDIGPVPTGPDCPAGTHLADVRYLSGQSGQGCVDG